MFDDTIIKNNEDPNTHRTGEKSKLLWSNISEDSMSNLTSLGEDSGSSKTGLFNFNKSIKNSIKILYLNNNSFVNVDPLKDFSNITELQLQCNLKLVNVDGLEKHELLDVLTLHYCEVSAIGTYNEEAKKYSGGLTGCKLLTKLTLNNNSSLGSLVGIESSIKLKDIIAYNCNITNIDSLKNHSAVEYLNLANNTNLISVKYIQHCKALKYIYLDNNVNMSNSELDIALNGSSDEYGRNVLIRNCVNSYNNIPKEFWGLFQDVSTVLDYSKTTLGKLLDVNSTEWIKLKGRTDITKLKLDGQTSLPMNDVVDGGVTKLGINSTLSGLTGMKALSLNGCSQINSINFVTKMKELKEIDLRSISTTLLDYSSLNSCTKICRLLIDNSNIDLKKIVTTINRIDSNRYGNKDEESWISSGYIGLGLYSYGPWVFYDESEENKLKSFRYCWMTPAYEGSVKVDLSNVSCNVVNGLGNDNYANTFILPSTVTNLAIDCARNTAVDFSGFKSGTVIEEFSYGHNSDKCLKETLNSIPSNVIINKLRLWSGAEISSDDLNFNAIKTVELWDDNGRTINWNLKCFENNTFTQELLMEARNGKAKVSLSNLDSLGKNRTINNITFRYAGVNSTSWLSGMTQVTDLDLSNNNISDISGLANLENLKTLNLSNNSIADLSPLMTAIGEDKKINYTSLNVSNNNLDGYTDGKNVETLLKLHQAGLQKVTITNNNFSDNEINDLKNGTTINGVSYTGFGSGNVIN